MEKEFNNQDKAEQVRKENLEKILEPVIINKDLTPDEKVKEISSIIIGIKHEEMFSGPMPPPHLLREYQQMIPDAALRTSVASIAVTFPSPVTSPLPQV